MLTEENSRNAQLQVLLDKQEIYEALVRYCRGIDRADVEMIRSAFHPDAYDDHGYYRGTDTWGFAEALVKPRHLRTAEAAGGASQMDANVAYVASHYLHNVLISVDSPSTAHVESYCIAVNGRQDAPELSCVGARYADRFENRNGEWRIAHRVVVMDWTAAVQNTWPERSANLSTYVWGRRDPSDITYERPLRFRRDVADGTPT